MNACFGTVVYESAFRYSKDFIKAVNSQTDKRFDVLIINDNLCEEQIEVYKNQIKNNVFIIDSKEHFSISRLRVLLLETALSYGYDLIVLADADDAFSVDRLKCIKDVFNSQYTFYYNDIYDFNDHLLLKDLPKYTCSVNEILECNYLGLSNTAINIKNLSAAYLSKMKKVKTNIFDWYLFTKLLNDGYMGKYVNDAKTFYRIHDTNIAGIPQISKDIIIREIDIKLEHYSLLREENLDINKLYNEYLKLKNLSDMIGNSYLDLNINNYWWGFIRISRIPLI